jgi:hypothetical protein
MARNVGLGHTESGSGSIVQEEGVLPEGSGQTFPSHFLEQGTIQEATLLGKACLIRRGRQSTIKNASANSKEQAKS